MVKLCIALHAPYFHVSIGTFVSSIKTAIAEANKSGTEYFIDADETALHKKIISSNADVFILLKDNHIWEANQLRDIAESVFAMTEDEYRETLNAINKEGHLKIVRQKDIQDNYIDLINGKLTLDTLLKKVLNGCS